MTYHQLGNSSLQISRIGFGCMSLKADNAENAKLLDRAAASGINYFDTADLYERGANETLVGKALKHRRKEVVLATKVGNQWRSDGSGWDWNPRKTFILQAVEGSLQRLQTDYIDLYQLHGGTIDDPIEEAIEAFELLTQQGKICYYGISSIRPNVIREWVERSRMVSVMMQYSLLDRRPEENCLDLLHQNGIGVLARGSVAQGMLINKPATEYLGYSSNEVAQAKKGVQELSQQRSPAQSAAQFVLAHPAVAAAVLGIRTIEQLEEASRVTDVPFLSSNEYQLLKNVLPANQYKEHR